MAAQNYNNLVINRTHQVDGASNQPQAVNNPHSSAPNRQAKSTSAKKFQPLWFLPVVLLIASSLLSYFIIFKPAKVTFTQDPNANIDTSTDENGILNIAGLPKDQICPLNGKMFTTTEKEAWSQRRPLAVMVENTPDARPQSGLSSADVVYEAVAEGGITRFMPIFYCAAQVDNITIAPIRSARTYYIDLASGYNRPLYVHVGGANLPGPSDALGQLGEYGWNGENDINQFSVGYPTFVRNYNRVPGKEVATEHTMETTSEALWAVGKKRGWTNMSPELAVGKKTIAAADWSAGYTGWKFKDGAAAGSVSNIKYDFWSGYSDYSVEWKYDSATNTYKRFQSGGAEAHIDSNNDQQIAASNVVLMFVKEEGPINENKHMLYGTIGTGKATVFQNGEAIDANWSKKSRESELEFTDAKGQSLEFVRGQIWVSVLDKSNKPTY